MGTVHEAQVEVLAPRVATTSFGGCLTHTAVAPDWESLCRWELGKDYAFARAFYSVAERDWPRDAEPIIGEEQDEDFKLLVDGHRHADGLLVAALEPVDDIEWCWWSVELVATVRRLVESGKTVRVLWWEG